ncbi:MAG: M20/M25/M40 family metallo-hydrolase [Hyphomonadaceae bacterium]|nr:M20/M25/M40 family metallo-hydrolase [Hyphomonadaceae bacterium]
MRALAFAAFLAFTATTAAAQTAPAPTPLPANVARNLSALQANALASDMAMETVTDLVTMVGPRPAGSEAEARARNWGADFLRRAGFANVRIEPFTIAAWDATREEGAITAPIQQRMVLAALGGSASTPAGGLEAEIVRFTDMAALEAAPESAVRGRIVFIDEPMTRTQDGSGYGAAVVKRGRCAPVAQSKGAVGCLIRSVGTDDDRFAHQGGLSRQPEGVSLPAASIAPADADVLARLAARGPVRVRLNIQATFSDNAPSGNVIGEIRGRERPEEVVLMVAHLDSWDLGQGAIDNGAGVAIITSAARLIAALPGQPRRTIRVVLVGSEEIGGLGGVEYARAHGGDRYAAAAESDFGAGRVWNYRWRFGPDAQGHAQALGQALAPLGVVADDSAEAGGGTDLRGINAAGVALVDLSQDGSLYFDAHHTANDTLDRIDPEALRQNVAAYATFAYLAADTDWVFAAPANEAPR